mgnify:CR=1 FL=1
MRLYGFVLVICIFGIAGCSQNGIDRSSAAKLIENSAQFKAIKDIPSDWIPLEVSVPVDPSKCSGWGAKSISDANYQQGLMRGAEELGFFELTETESSGRGSGCTLIKITATLTDKGSSEIKDILDRFSRSDLYRFPALTFSVHEISGIKLDPSGTGATVEFDVALSDGADSSYAIVGKALFNHPSAYTARLELYDDGWRVKKLSSND